MTQGEKNKLLSALKHIRQGLYGNYIPNTDTERELDRIYKKTVEKIENL